ncbi:hypothetical protein [Halosolutus halophilus]|uniref:hypothetical protein n=1 Tax=Halosolutus halophilus TaxID=1552990 RepID=UPI0022352724|nr:hypothetical protein [Halosolutus halophilus]
MSDREGIRTRAIALVLTTIVVLGLTFVSASAGGVTTTLAGDEEVEQDDVITLELTIESEDDERISANGFLLNITDQEGNGFEQVFTADGTPVTNVSDSEKISEREVDPTLEREAEAEAVGTGDDKTKGYGYEQVETDRDDSETIIITLNAQAFDVNEYDAQVEIITEEIDETYEPPEDTLPSDDLETDHASNVHTFAVIDTVEDSDKRDDSNEVEDSDK